MQVQSLGQKDPLDKEMATHSSILVWKIPWTEEPGGLQSRCGHKESDSERSCSPSLLSNSMLVKHVSEIKMPTHFILLSLTEIRFKDTSMSYPVVFALSLGFTLIMLSRSLLLKKKKIRSVSKYSHSIF